MIWFGEHRGEWGGYLTEALNEALTGRRWFLVQSATTTIYLIVLDRKCCRVDLSDDPVDELVLSIEVSGAAKKHDLVPKMTVSQAWP